MQIKTKKILIAKRVSYGKASTPMEDREYRITFGGPVGTKKEWKEWARKNKKLLKFKE